MINADIVPIVGGGGGRHAPRRFDPSVIKTAPATPAEEPIGIKTAGARGAVLSVHLHTPRENDGTPAGPQRLAVYSELGVDDELDLAGARDLRTQLAALLPRLDAMISALAASQDDGGA